MAQLIVLLNNKNVGTLELDSAKQYTVGRAENCDLVLPPERGISRQHFKLLFTDGTWKLEVLSRYGELYFNEQKVPELILNENCEFSIPPLKFQFVREPTITKSQDIDPVMPSIAPFDERTFVGVLTLIPYLKLFDRQGNTIQSFRLEGEAWVAGRDTTCSIFIDNPKISRRQFEIQKNEQSYLIRDFGSSNGTLVNNEAIPSKEWTLLQSGDVINIVDWSLQFELRDAGFEQRLIEASPFLNAPIVYETEAPPPTTPRLQYEPTATYIPPADDLRSPYQMRSPVKKTNWVRTFTIGIAVVGAIAYYFQDETTKEIPRGPAEAKKTNPFDQLKPEQQQFVRQTHKLAKELFMQGRYEMARQEVLKIYQFVQVYEDSKEIESAAAEAIQIQQERARLEEKEREKIEIEEKIQRQLKFCRTKVNSKVEVHEIDDCLSSVIQFNPEHPGMQKLKAEVDEIIAQRNIAQAEKEDLQERVQRHKAIFDRAVSIQRKGRPLEAIVAFEDVLNSKLPDPKNLKAQARREIASIQQKLADQQSDLEKQADGFYKKGDLKKAITALKKAVDINPGNSEIKDRISTMMTELKKQMQVLYQEGILEESVGEVETAKTKWKKIIEQSLPEEEYFKKASIKLKKYGAN